MAIDAFSYTYRWMDFGIWLWESLWNAEKQNTRLQLESMKEINNAYGCWNEWWVLSAQPVCFFFPHPLQKESTNQSWNNPKKGLIPPRKIKANDPNEKLGDRQNFILRQKKQNLMQNEG